MPGQQIDEGRLDVPRAHPRHVHARDQGLQTFGARHVRLQDLRLKARPPRRHVANLRQLDLQRPLPGPYRAGAVPVAAPSSRRGLGVVAVILATEALRHLQLDRVLQHQLGTPPNDLRQGQLTQDHLLLKLLELSLAGQYFRGHWRVVPFVERSPERLVGSLKGTIRRFSFDSYFRT